ncbi:hypothetical protein [Azospirillum sp. B506]|uniref:hypothetical protein n=1 Tax=Azospirillum sp. B506 TaxID=137721 RepID=UPI0003484318|nr:hypothetical protein [Azospirillum sp. B506]
MTDQTQQPPTDGPDRSPDFLAGPTMRQTGGRRLTRVPIYILIGISALVAIAIAYTMNERAKRRAAGVGSTEVVAAPEPVDAKPLFGAAQSAGIIEARRAAPPPATPATPPAITPATLPGAPPDPMGRGPAANGGRTLEDDARMRAWQQYDAEVRRIEEQRRAALKAALEAPTTVPSTAPSPGRCSSRLRPVLAPPAPAHKHSPNSPTVSAAWGRAAAWAGPVGLVAVPAAMAAGKSAGDRAPARMPNATSSLSSRGAARTTSPAPARRHGRPMR